MTVAGNYSLDVCIGRGNFGDVYKGTRLTTHDVFAIKVINLDESTEEIKILIREIQFLVRIQSPYIVRYEETFINGYYMFIVMEYCGGQSCSDLIKYLKKVPESIVAYIIRSVLRGLEYLHSEGKVHRDIKSANILVTDDGHVKLADFGVSGQITYTQVKRNTFVGTPFWMAPEVISREKSRSVGYNEKADIWSTGITAIELLTGTVPYPQEDPMKILFQIPKRTPPKLVGPEFSDNSKDFVRYCLVKDPERRPSANIMLHHAFIKSGAGPAELSQIVRKKNAKFKTGKKGKVPRYDLKALECTDSEWNFKSYNLAKDGKIQNGNAENDNVQNGSFHPSQRTKVSVPREDLLFYCLAQVQSRGITQDTRQTVGQIIEDLARYEASSPGLTQAIVEEMLFCFENMRLELQ